MLSSLAAAASYLAVLGVLGLSRSRGQASEFLMATGAIYAFLAGGSIWGIRKTLARAGTIEPAQPEFAEKAAFWLFALRLVVVATLLRSLWRLYPLVGATPLPLVTKLYFAMTIAIPVLVLVLTRLDRSWACGLVIGSNVTLSVRAIYLNVSFAVQNSRLAGFYWGALAETVVLAVGTCVIAWRLQLCLPNRDRFWVALLVGTAGTGALYYLLSLASLVSR